MRKICQVMVVLVGVLVSVAPAWCRADSTPVVRVALMDFSTDDNSYRSIQAAADFTSLVQMGLMGEAGIEWVERSQISLAKQEFGLAEMKAGRGLSPLRRGRMLGADRVVTGHFSSDDHSRATLSVQVIELKYADVIANETLTLPDNAKGWIAIEPSQVKFVVVALQSLFAKALERQPQTTNQARVAFLFLADTTGWPAFDRGTEVLPREFFDRLERAAATNGHLRLIHFPKAYQSTDEAELAVDGIIEAGQDSWSRTADLYVWGTYSLTNARTAGGIESRLDLVLNLWDGDAQPTTLKESMRMAARENIPPAQTSELIDRLIRQVIARARPQRSEQDSAVVRQQIADSIVKAYVAMTGRSHSQPGLNDRGKFVQAVQMLETACFFDPDNADARLLWVTCRYGWWIDFGFNVKNQFWTKWRRSQAWGKYVERFGLKPGKVQLPFPYHVPGSIPATFVRSLDEVSKMFPQWNSMEEAVAETASEDQSRQQGVHTALMEAEFHGFPRQMPPTLTMKWKTEITNEVTHRGKRATEYSQAQGNSTNELPAKALSRPAGATANQTSLTPRQRPTAATPMPRSARGVSPMVPTPDWLKNRMSIYGMFRLYPPNALPYELKPEVQVIKFPHQFEVKVIRQLAFHKNQLWILAMDERSSPSSAVKPDLAGETREERNRLWCLDSDGIKLDLFKFDALPVRINSFLFQDDQLWLAGDSVGVLDLKRQTLRHFGLAEGLAMKEVEALAAAGGRLYAAGDDFKLSFFDPGSSHWGDLPLPLAGFSHGTGNPYLLTGNQQWLGYVAGVTLFYHQVGGSWTNLTLIKSARCFAPDGPLCWIGAANGLHCHDADKQTLRSWNAPVFIQSPMASLMGSAFMGGNSTLPQNRLEELDAQIRGCLAKLEKVRQQAQAARKNQKAITDPFHMDSHIPGEVAAIANDGDFLWVGVVNYFGSYLLLLHKPSLSLVAGYTMGVRDSISSLAVSDRYVWVGTAYGDDVLIRLRKDSFFSVPRNQWVSIAIAPEERERRIRRMSARDQAMYAFYAGDDRRVAQLLGGLDPKKASLEELFVLAKSCDASGTDDPQQARAWFQHIGSRYPDSPWSTVANEAMQEAESRHQEKQARALQLSKFDRNQDGVLDKAERLAMEKDPAHRREQNAVEEERLNAQLTEIIKNFDRNGNRKLESEELAELRGRVVLYSQAPPEMLSGRKILVAPLMTKTFPATADILKRYDADKNGAVDETEMKKLAQDLRKNP